MLKITNAPFGWTGLLTCVTAISSVVMPAAAATLEEVVVTAQKRSASLQDTPLSISAVTAETIENRGIFDVSDIAGIAPNLTTATLPGSTANMAVSIRGIVNQEPILTADSPVAIYVDGIVLGRSTGAAFDMVDLERIEVLRGPQGTLYGRNTTGGAVNLISAKPNDEAGARLQLRAGNFDYRMGRLTLDSGEIGGSGLRSKLTVLHKERDGYVDASQMSDSNDPGAYDVDAARLAVSWDKGTKLTADYSYDHSQRDSSAIPFQLVAVSPILQAYLDNSPAVGGSSLVRSSQKLENLNTQTGPIEDRVSGHGLTLNYALSDTMTIRSMTGYRKWKNTVRDESLDGNYDLRGLLVSPAILAPPFTFEPIGIGEIDLFAAENDRSQNQFSQEFNLLGSWGDHLDYVVGAFYFKEESSERNPQSLTLILPSPVPIPFGDAVYEAFGVNVTPVLEYEHEAKSSALFAQIDYRLSEQWSLNGGVRYTKDEKELTQVSPMARSLDKSFNEVNWTAGIQYRWTDDALLYGRIATGYKSGGLNPRATNDGYDPETLTSFELGLKSEWWQRRLRFNTAVFHSQYDDLQVDQFQAGSGGTTSITVNAGEVDYTGIEVELVWAPGGGFQLAANAGYVDREYTEFLVRDPMTNALIDVADEARFTYSAASTVSISPSWEQHVGELGLLSARLDYDYRSRAYWHPVDRFLPFNPDIAQQRGYDLLGARIGLSEITWGNSEVSIALWGKNLLDEDYRVSGIDFGSLGFAGAVYGEGRTWGVDLSLTW